MRKILFVLAWLYCAFSVCLAAEATSATTTNRTTSASSSETTNSIFSRGTGVFLSLGAVRNGMSDSAQKWYAAPWSNNASTGFDGGLRLAFFNQKSTLGIEIKGFVSFDTLSGLSSVRSEIDMFGYGGGLNGIWQPFKYLGIYAGGGYEQTRFSDHITMQAPHGAYANGGIRIGYPGLYVDLFYKYSFYTVHLGGGIEPFNQSVVGLSVVFPLVDLIASMLTPRQPHRGYRGERGFRGGNDFNSYHRGYYDAKYNRGFSF